MFRYAGTDVDSEERAITTPALIEAASAECAPSR